MDVPYIGGIYNELLNHCIVMGICCMDELGVGGCSQ